MSPLLETLYTPRALEVTGEVLTEQILKRGGAAWMERRVEVDESGDVEYRSTSKLRELVMQHATLSGICKLGAVEAGQLLPATTSSKCGTLVYQLHLLTWRC